MSSVAPRSRSWLRGKVLAGVMFSAKAATPSVHAQLFTGATTNPNVVDATLKATLEQRLGVKNIDSLTRVPFGGLIEVRIGTDIVYTDPKGEFLFVGNVINSRTMENITRARVEGLVAAATPKVDFSELPLDSAIKYVKGNGKRRLAVFADPNCTFCKRFEVTLQEVDDVTIYVFLYPILGPDSVVKSKAIWCSPDRAKAWLDWMLSGTIPTGPTNCRNPIDNITALGRLWRVTATPTVVFSNGRRLPGALPLENLKRLIDQSSS